MKNAEHEDRIREEFTKQAALFAESPKMRDEEALRKLIELVSAGPADTVLDVACGPGIVVCAFAQVVANATGIDLTPAMIERARSLQEEKGLTNVSWQVGDVRRIPFSDGSFSIVTSRYAFHHLEEPQAVLAEMVRVCKPGGRIVVVDVAASDTRSKADAFNRMEKQRDPSHVRAMNLTELEGLFLAENLSVTNKDFYRIDFDVDTLLQGSFPADGDREGLRKVFRASVKSDGLGVNTREMDGKLVCSYPIALLLAQLEGKRSWLS